MTTIEVDDADRAEIDVEALAESQAELGKVGHAEGREQGVEARLHVRHIQAGQLAEHTDDPGRQNAEQDRTLDVVDIQHRRDE